jgi:hypothetical protein
MGTAMTDFGLIRGGIKGLGAGAYLVNVLPSAVMTLGLLALITSHLYPWSEPLRDAQGREISPGVASITNSLESLGALGAVLLAFAILVITVLIRPFQISAVQWLEGYSDRRVTAPFLALAVEWHTRRRSLLRARSHHQEMLQSFATRQFEAVALQARINHRAGRIISSAKEALGNYPNQVEDIMPTLLGNMLRRAEQSAGERYGLDTVVTYPCLYPYLSPRLSQEAQTQSNVLDAASMFTIIDAFLAVAASPLLVRGDAWSLIPAGLTLIAVMSYRGAKSAAGRYAVVLAAAFDLHRFDMLRAMHRRLPDNAVDEYSDNQELCRVLAGERPIDEPEPRRWVYIHPSSTEGEN